MPAKGQTKFTPERERAILTAIEVGAPYRHAAWYAGVSEDTLARWRKRYAAFADAIKEAEAKALVGRLARIRRAEDEHWQAAAWWAERKYPQEFGKTVQEQQHTGKDGAPLEVVFRRTSK
jgi:transposase-like protein